ncbi:hypothetical protein BH10PSE17_BH10PSE17_38430 [soil metagenome]
MKLLRAIATVTVMSALAACASAPDKPTLLALPSVAATAPATAVPALQPHALVLRRIAVPEYIDSREVRYRSDKSRVESFKSTVWAERIELGMTRELSAGLRNRLPEWLVCNGACGDRAVDGVLSVDWNSLDLDRTGQKLSIDVQWVLLDNAAKRGTPSANGRLVKTIVVKGDSADAYANAIAEAVDQLSVDVVTRGIPQLQH